MITKRTPRKKWFEFWGKVRYVFGKPMDMKKTSICPTCGQIPAFEEVKEEVKININDIYKEMACYYQHLRYLNSGRKVYDYDIQNLLHIKNLLLSELIKKGFSIENSKKRVKEFFRTV